MALYDLRDYLSKLEEAGELCRIEAEVDSHLEVGAIVQRLAERGGPAAQFLKVRGAGSGVTLLGGMMSRGARGVWTRVALALDMDATAGYREILDEFVKRVEAPIKPLQVGGGYCKENIVAQGDVNLSDLGAPYIHEGDGGPCLTSWAFTVVKEPGTGYVAWDVLPLMVRSETTLTGAVPESSEIGSIFFGKYEPADEPMPFAIVLGAVPAATMAAALRRRRGGTTASEIAGGLQRDSLQMVKCESNDLLVPGSAEMIIEGVVLPGERAEAGPFSESYGYRTAPNGLGPVFEVRTMTHRTDPILPFCPWGTPITEIHLVKGLDCDSQLKQAFEKRGAPVVDVFTPPWLAGSVVAVATKVPYTAYSQSVAGVVRITEASKYVPYILVCDDDIDITNPVALFHALVTKCHPKRDTWIVKESRAAASAPYLTANERNLNKGAAAIFDCTWPTDWDRSIAVPPRVSFDQCYPKALQEKVMEEWTAELGFPKETDRPV